MYPRDLQLRICSGGFAVVVVSIPHFIEGGGDTYTWEQGKIGIRVKEKDEAGKDFNVFEQFL